MPLTPALEVRCTWISGSWRQAWYSKPAGFHSEILSLNKQNFTLNSLLSHRYLYISFFINNSLKYNAFSYLSHMSSFHALLLFETNIKKFKYLVLLFVAPRYTMKPVS